MGHRGAYKVTRPQTWGLCWAVVEDPRQNQTCSLWARTGKLTCERHENLESDAVCLDKLHPLRYKIKRKVE